MRQRVYSAALNLVSDEIVLVKIHGQRVLGKREDRLIRLLFAYLLPLRRRCRRGLRSRLQHDSRTIGLTLMLAIFIVHRILPFLTLVMLLVVTKRGKHLRRISLLLLWHVYHLFGLLTDLLD